MAVSIATGKFVWWSGGYFNTHDIKVFQSSGLAFKFGVDPITGKPPKRGLADRGYYVANPFSVVKDCLAFPNKANKHERLSMTYSKMKQVILSVRILVEQAIGRLKVLERLSVKFRSSVGKLDLVKQKHRKIFNICINFTNLYMKQYPLRREPHWILCKGEISEEVVNTLVDSFISDVEDISLDEYFRSNLEAVLDLFEADFQ